MWCITIITTSCQTTIMAMVGSIITRVMAGNITDIIAVTARLSAYSLADRMPQTKRRHPGLLHGARRPTNRSQIFHIIAAEWSEWNERHRR
jgi:hypothetical protein